MLLMIDNYDSFTYNLVLYFGELGQEVKTFRNDQITIEEIKKLDPKYIVISPGPCTPKESGISMQVIDSFKENKPILGVCLGHQAIGAVFGANIIKAKELMHGYPRLFWGARSWRNYNIFRIQFLYFFYRYLVVSESFNLLP